MVFIAYIKSLIRIGGQKDRIINVYGISEERYEELLKEVQEE